MPSPVTASFPEIAEVAKEVLAKAGSAEMLLEKLRPAIQAEQVLIRQMLTERVQTRLVGVFQANRSGAKRPINPTQARDNCRIITDEIIKDGGFLPRLARWLSVNIAFWLWQGDGFTAIDGDSVGALIGLFVESQAEIISDNFTPPKAPLSHLEEILGVIANPAAIPPGMMVALSAHQFQILRDALSKNSFDQQPGGPWPTAPLGKIGSVQLRPPFADDAPYLPRIQLDAWVETMWRQQSELSDRDADVLDALCSLYLSKAGSADEAVIADVSQLLEMRGLRPKLSGSGRRGGYEAEQREETLRALTHIQNLWLDIAEVEIDGKGKTLQSRPFLITDRMGRKRPDGSFEMERFVFRPGRAFAAFLFNGSRHLMFQQALRYDPYRHHWEKRLTRYFCWHWGEQSQSQIHTVRALLQVGGAEASTKVRTRIEKALSTLQSDGIIADWRYAEEALVKTGPYSLTSWLESAVWVQAPLQLSHYYAADKPTDDLAERLRLHRRSQGLTQAELAQQLGITQGQISKIESGQPVPSPALRGVIEQWLGTGSD